MFIDVKQPAAVANSQPVAAQAAAAQPAQIFDLEFLLGVLWRRRGIICAVTALCVAAAVLFGLFAPARYTASTQILIDPNDLRVIDNGLRSQNQLTETHVTQVENQIRVLVSSNVARRVVEKLSLDRDPEFVGRPSFDPLGMLRALFGTSSAVKRDPVLDAMQVLKDRIRSRRADRTYVVDASV